jgi:hypothetical protein
LPGFAVKKSIGGRWEKTQMLVDGEVQVWSFGKFLVGVPGEALPRSACGATQTQTSAPPRLAADVKLRQKDTETGGTTTLPNALNWLRLPCFQEALGRQVSDSSFLYVLYAAFHFSSTILSLEPSAVRIAANFPTREFGVACPRKCHLGLHRVRN